MKKDPKKILLIVVLILVLVSIAMQLFWNKKFNSATGEVGYFNTEPKDESLTEPTTAG